MHECISIAICSHNYVDFELEARIKYFKWNKLSHLHSVLNAIHRGIKCISKGPKYIQKFCSRDSNDFIYLDQGELKNRRPTFRVTGLTFECKNHLENWDMQQRESNLGLLTLQSSTVTTGLAPTMVTACCLIWP